MIMPSVTEVLQPWSDFSGIPPSVLEAAAARGTAVHDVCATIARGLPVFNAPPETDGYVTSFRRWFDVMVDDVLLVEERIVDPDFGFHGEPDLIIKSKSEEILLIDNKTPRQLVKSWRLQCAAYRHLATCKGIDAVRTASLRLEPDGGIAKMEYYDHSLKDFNLFLQCLNIFRFFHRR